jgi:hypothetical protein
MKKRVVNFIFFCSCLLTLACGRTYRNAIKPYVKYIDKMEMGLKKEQTFLHSSSLSSQSICERYFLVPRAKNTFYTNLGSDLVLNGSDRYETFYVYTKTIVRDNRATKDEMTPLIFLNSRLIGKGWSIYDSLFIKQ